MEDLAIRSLARTGYQHDDGVTTNLDKGVPKLPYDEGWIQDHSSKLSQTSIHALRRVLVVREWEEKSM